MNTEQASSRIPTLDGWRDIAILLVLFNHVMNACVNNVSSPWLATGHHGVTLFSVLSGFLITANLIAGPIDLKLFYIRRFFRLMPVAWAYLGVFAPDRPPRSHRFCRRNRFQSVFLSQLHRNSLRQFYMAFLVALP